METIGNKDQAKTESCIYLELPELTVGCVFLKILLTLDTSAGELRISSTILSDPGGIWFGLELDLVVK